MLSARQCIILGILFVAFIYSPGFSRAFDLQESNDSPIKEATSFFQELILNSKNPIIVSMAKASLDKLNIPTGQEKPVKKVAEVSLLPQYDSTYVVPAIINEKYVATFLIDTGASYTVITPKMIEFMGIKIPEHVEKIPVSTANGVVYAPIIQLKQVTLGGMSVNNVDVVVTDLGDEMQISGLLGMSYFKGMELSFKQNKLVLSR